ncbi:MAG: ArsA family ATPase [Acidimicrobiales bacterium]
MAPGVDLLSRKLIFVTGKGGVGKTTVSAALGLLGASRGLRTLVCAVDAKGNLAEFLESGPIAFTERRVAPRLWAMAMDTEASLRQYLSLQLKIPFVTRVGPLAHALDFVAVAAPGVKEIVTVGKLCWEVRERHYDLVVVDAPATGHVVGHLAAPQAINSLVGVGLVRQQTDWMTAMLSDPATTGVVIVAAPAEMPVTETVDLAERLKRETEVELAAVVVNRVLPELFGRGEEELFERLSGAEAMGALEADLHASAEPLFEAARLMVTMRRSRTEHLESLRAQIPAQTPILYLPYLFFRSHGLRASRQVADALSAELGY